MRVPILPLSTTSLSAGTCSPRQAVSGVREIDRFFVPLVGLEAGLEMLVAKQDSHRWTTWSWRDYKLILACFYATMLACSYVKHRSMFLC
jgi:hypothetical protein